MKFDRSGKTHQDLGAPGTRAGQLQRPARHCHRWVGEPRLRGRSAEQAHPSVRQDGNFLAAWPQFGEVNSVFVSKDDTIYAGTSFDDRNATKGEVRGILVGSARDGSLKAFIPDPVDLNTVIRGTAASGITADADGNIYAADVGSHNLRKYVLQGPAPKCKPLILCRPGNQRRPRARTGQHRPGKLSSRCWNNVGVGLVCTVGPQ